MDSRKLILRLSQVGVVDGTRDNCAELMRARQAILVYPGGAREVTKSAEERYQLLWKKRTGFARMAIAHGCPIVPFGAVGVEDALDVTFDVRKSVVGDVVRKVGLRDDLLMPMVRGVGALPVPRPERLYFGFAPPVDPSEFGTSADDEEAAWALRELVRERVEASISSLREQQAHDPERRLSRRVAHKVKAALRNRIDKL